MHRSARILSSTKGKGHQARTVAGCPFRGALVFFIALDILLFAASTFSKGAVVFESNALAGDSAVTSLTTCSEDGGKGFLVGAWMEKAEGLRIRVVFASDGAFTRTQADSQGTETARGRYWLQGGVLTVVPEGGQPLRFTVRVLQQDRLVIEGEDGTPAELIRTKEKGLGKGTLPDTGAAPEHMGPGRRGPGQAREPSPQAGPREGVRDLPPAAPAMASRAKGSDGVGGLIPDWVRPGLRLTYYLMTGSLPGSVNGWVPDEEGRWVDRQGNHYSTERKGYSSHGLIQATVAGMDGQVVALAQPFYLFSGNDTTPVLNSTMDSLVTSDTGGDFWMHPRKQAQVLQEHPWTHVPQAGQTVARTVTWRGESQTWTATAMAILGESSRTLYVFDQVSGRLLYLSRLARHGPDIRDPGQSLPDSVSYATFLRFIGSRHLRLPWLDAPQPEWVQRLQSLAYRGEMRLEFPGAHPTPLAVSQDLQVARRGHGWAFFQCRLQTQGSTMPNDYKAVTGPGCLPPLVIPPGVLERLHPGQEIDRDPNTGFVVRVTGADDRTVILQADGARQSFIYVYDRSQGLLVRRISRQHEPNTPQMINVRDLQLTGWQ